MPIQSSLRRWVAAGLLEEAQAEGIASFEKNRGRPLLLYAIAGLGALAIAIGVVSIVAANWDRVPGQLKIAIDLALVAGLGYGVTRWHRDGPGWAREASILVLYGLVMASIALIGQVYQLGGKAHQAMGVWTVLTVLLITRGGSAGLAFIWLLGLQGTYGAWLFWAGDTQLGDLEELALAGVYWGPLLTLLAGRWRWLQQIRPRFAKVFETVGWSELVLCASLGTLAFYEDTFSEKWKGLWLGLIVSTAITAWLWTRLEASPVGRAGRWLLVACLGLSHLPLLLSPGDWDVVAALTFIGLWLLVALVAHRGGHLHLLNLATAVIGVRILVVYFEVFGSLLSTGIGLVTGGLLTLALVWLWVRKRRDFHRQLAVEESR